VTVCQMLIGRPSSPSLVELKAAEVDTTY
jgi:hypothetical protein